MKRVIIIDSQYGDWSILYIDGKEISQNHVLGEGKHRLYLLQKALEYNFTFNDIEIFTAGDNDEEHLNDNGNFPAKLKDLIDEYNF